MRIGDEFEAIVDGVQLLVLDLEAEVEKQHARDEYHHVLHLFDTVGVTSRWTYFICLGVLLRSILVAP